MAFLAHWTKLRMKNPGLNDDDSKMTITVSSFKASLNKAYDSGHADAAKALDGLMGAKESNPMKDLFGGMFG